MNKNFEKCVLFFAKFPEAGKVKSRLAAVIGDSLAVKLYRHFVLDLMSKVNYSAVNDRASYESAQPLA
jgi:glycosyltransferase A (GT-A) superfamily protein (DUF2064 family)